MKHTLKTAKSIVIYIFLSALFTNCSNDKKVTVIPKEDKSTVLNPKKGWMAYVNEYWWGPDWDLTGKYGGGSPFDYMTDEMWEVAKCGYARIHWIDIEPNENDYKWERIDQAVEELAAHGKKLAFGIMCYNPWEGKRGNLPYTTPKWVFDAGAKYYVSARHKHQFVPVWDDPVFLEKVRDLTNAIAERYDGKLEYFEIRSYGDYGESQQRHCEGEFPTKEGFEEHIKIAYDAFEKTPISMVWWDDLFSDIMNKYMKEHDLWIRNDNATDEKVGYCINAIGHVPSIKETCIATIGLEGIELGKVSYAEMNNWAEQVDIDSSMIYRANRMGYHFVLEEAVISASLGNGKAGSISLSINNKGLTQYYGDATFKLALMDKDYKILETIEINTINISNWTPDEISNVKADFSFHKNKSGKKLAIGLFSDYADENPDIKLANELKIIDGWQLIID